MSETEKTNITLPFMSATDIARLSVSALSNRPNEHSGRYGRKGLTPEELKAAFSALPKEIAEKLNELLPKILARFDKTEDAFRDAISEALTKNVEKIRPADFSSQTVYVYGEVEDDGTVLVKANTAAEPNTLVYRDVEGCFVTPNPKAGEHSVNKSYFDNKSNNSLYPEVSDITRRMISLEYAASGNAYNTETLSGNASAVQVDNACPYGVITRLGGNVAKIAVGLPFDTYSAVAHYGNPITENVTPNSLSMPTGEKANVRIPCNISAPCTAYIYAEENDDNVSLNKGGFSNQKANPIIQGLFSTTDSKATVTLNEGNENAKYIAILKSSQGTALTAPFYINNIRVMLSDPTKAELMYPIDEIEIPAEVRALPGYGEEGAYIDLVERRFYNASGNATDISIMLPDEADVISLLPSAILKFTDANGNAVVVDYEITYKNKL